MSAVDVVLPVHSKYLLAIVFVPSILEKDQKICLIVSKEKIL